MLLLKQIADFKSTQHENKNNHFEGTVTDVCSKSLNLVMSGREYVTKTKRSQ
jgi:hypothetical protein